MVHLELMSLVERKDLYDVFMKRITSISSISRALASLFLDPKKALAKYMATLYFLNQHIFQWKIFIVGSWQMLSSSSSVLFTIIHLTNTKKVRAISHYVSRNLVFAKNLHAYNPIVWHFPTYIIMQYFKISILIIVTQANSLFLIII